MYHPSHREGEDGGSGPSALPDSGRVRVVHDGAPARGRLEGLEVELDSGARIVPAVVAASDFSPDRFELRTYLNGDVVQEGDPDDLVFRPAYLLADLCRLITLEPGDVVITGTPANSRPMEPGDLVEVEISGLGRLANRVVESEPVAPGPGATPEISAQTLHVALAIPEEQAEREVTTEGGNG